MAGHGCDARPPRQPRPPAARRSHHLLLVQRAALPRAPLWLTDALPSAVLADMGRAARPKRRSLVQVANLRLNHPGSSGAVAGASAADADAGAGAIGAAGAEPAAAAAPATAAAAAAVPAASAAAPIYTTCKLRPLLNRMLHTCLATHNFSTLLLRYETRVPRLRKIKIGRGAPGRGARAGTSAVHTRAHAARPRKVETKEKPLATTSPALPYPASSHQSPPSRALSAP